MEESLIKALYEAHEHLGKATGALLIERSHSQALENQVKTLTACLERATEGKSLIQKSNEDGENSGN